MMIQDLREGQHVSQIFYCRTKSEGTAKTGKNFYSLKLQDKSGGIDAKVWDLSNAIEHFDSGSFIYCDGDVQSYNNALQLNLKRIRRAYEGEYDPRDYFPTSDQPIDGMYEQLMKLESSVEQPNLRRLLDSFFLEDPDFIERFKTHSAAKSVHHNFIGGLLEHTLRVTQLCDFFCRQYPILNRDLLLTAAMCHDIGKLDELAPFPQNDYTDEGQLIGHVIIGYSMVKDKIEEQNSFPERLKSELLHCILAHHGELEYGSPKKPSIIEALLLSHADDTDAKAEIMIEEFSQTHSMDFLGLNKYLGTNIRRSTPKSE